jgi:hypothetical protein
MYPRTREETFRGRGPQDVASNGSVGLMILNPLLRRGACLQAFPPCFGGDPSGSGLSDRCFQGVISLLVLNTLEYRVRSVTDVPTVQKRRSFGAGTYKVVLPKVPLA